MKVAQRRSQQGFGLIEVLITLVVIAFGVLAHVSFQRATFREASLSSGRSTATEIALDKIDDLRSYSVLSTTSGQFAFQDIANNTGGSLPTGTVTQDNTTFSRSWTVTDYWYTATNSAATTTAPTGNPLPHLKRVAVTLTWTDQAGQAQTLTLDSLIQGQDPSIAARVYQ